MAEPSAKKRRADEPAVTPRLCDCCYTSLATPANGQCNPGWSIVKLPCTHVVCAACSLEAIFTAAPVAPQCPHPECHRPYTELVLSRPEPQREPPRQSSRLVAASDAPTTYTIINKTVRIGSAPRPPGSLAVGMQYTKKERSADSA